MPLGFLGSRVLRVGGSIAVNVTIAVQDIDPACRALFVDSFGRRLPYHTLRRIVLKTGELAGLEKPLIAHMFRRSCTSELVRADANLYHVSRILGHENLDTLKHYVRLNIADIQATHRRTHPRELDEAADRGEPGEEDS